MDERTQPDFLTLDQAAAVLQIGRTAAYDLARLYRCSDGAEGLPVVRVGRQWRVPRALLEQWHGGPLSWPTLHTPQFDRARVVRVVWRSERTRRNASGQLSPPEDLTVDVHGRALA